MIDALDDPNRFASVEEISIQHEQLRAGVLYCRRRQLAKHVVAQVSQWATIVFVFADWRAGKWDKLKVSIQRWKLHRGRWMRSSHIHLDLAQAMGVVRICTGLDIEDIEARLPESNIC